MTGRSSVVFHNGIGVLIVGAPVPTVGGVAISCSAWHKARRLDASAHQADKRAHVYAFMDACVVIFALLNEEASISRLDNCNVQPTCGYIRHLFYLSVVYFLVMGCF